MSNSTKAALAVLLATRLMTACTPADHALWVANGSNVVEYTYAKLDGSSGAMTPHRLINSHAFGSPQAVTFDQHGNMWVTDSAGSVNGTKTPALFEFSFDQLAAFTPVTNLVPVATITSPALNFPQQSVFDAKGNLWVTDHSNSIVLVFTAAQLAAPPANSINPAVVSTSGGLKGEL